MHSGYNIICSFRYLYSLLFLFLFRLHSSYPLRWVSFTFSQTLSYYNTCLSLLLLFIN
ncbi:hypothetical protein C8R44DRAFT_794215 [Mycena epipterygia]|nr:hypothetical protein C8R44DRAFT_794215 [Mycena epipterygia]